MSTTNVSIGACNKAATVLLLATTVLTVLPLNADLVSGYNTSSPYPVLRAGDYWNFQYSSGETSHETISNDTCDGVSCTVDAEVSAQWSDVTWRNPDWSIIKENYTFQTTSYFDTYTPVVLPYDWPLVVGKQWTINATVNEITRNSTGTFPSTYKILRTRSVVGESSITVPAGTFDAFQIDEYASGLLHSHKWLSYQVADVLVDEHYYQGQFSYSSTLTSYHLAGTAGTETAGSGPGNTKTGTNATGQKSPSLPSIFSPTLITIAAVGIAVAATATLLAIRQERRRRRLFRGEGEESAGQSSLPATAVLGKK